MAAEADEKKAEGGTHDYDITEHLMSPAEVAALYATEINVEVPSKSGGLKFSEVSPLRHPRTGDNHML